MVSAENIYVNFGGFELFKGVTFLVNPKDRIGLVGKNGAGKSTLLKMLSGSEQPSAGKITIPKGVTIGYLPQQMQTADLRSVKEEAELAFGELLTIEKEIARLNSELSTREDYESPGYLKIIEKTSELNEHYQILGGGNYEAEIEQTLTGLGFERSDFDRPTSEFSGGWRMRIELAKILLKRPDVLLLDEPTNHLDIESIQWLEEFLGSYNGAVIMVSHDKAFLDAISTRTIEIVLGRIYDQKTNYSGFVKWKKEQQEQQQAAYRNQQKMIAGTEQFIERFRYKATKAVQVQSRIKQLERLTRIELEEEDRSALRIKFPPAPRSGSVIIEGRSLSKSYGSNLILNNIDITIEKKERVAFVGRNGEGKTTLARMILQELEYKGELKIGHNVKIGYYAQNQPELLDETKTVLETIDHIATGEVRAKIRDILGAFLFSGDDVDKKVKVLSGGERSRLAMIKLLLEPVNFLVLDEPTNHLDMSSREILTNALIEFDGTILVVSHDREFLDGLVNCVYEFRHKKIKQHLGGIYDFLRRKKLESLKQLEENTLKRNNGRHNPQKNTGAGGVSFEQKKEINRNILRLQRNVEKYEEEISDIEIKIAQVDQLLSQPGIIDDHSVYENYENLKSALKLAMEKWEEVHEELEKWQAKKIW